ncbi:MAG: hypothetical protein WCS70_09735 [Verrucomicrobiota bacterium]
MRNLIPALLLTLTLACASHVHILSGHREDVTAQARVFTIAARNLEDVTRGRGGDPADQQLAQAIATLHTDAESFARGAARWVSDDEVNSRYEKLITDWVQVKRGFASVKADQLTTDSYNRVAHEWEQLARTTGYAGKSYEKKLEEK